MLSPVLGQKPKENPLLVPAKEEGIESKTASVPIILLTCPQDPYYRIETQCWTEYSLGYGDSYQCANTSGEETMPIYEFYCEDCNTLFNFFSRAINTTKRPVCPRCKQKRLKRQMSTFARLTGAKEEGDMDDLPVDETGMEKAMNLLAREADSINEDDPRQAANLMRKFSDITGLNLGPSMEEALKRMEAGEDPEQVEAKMGDLIEDEEPFILGQKRGRGLKRSKPHRDETLYEL